MSSADTGATTTRTAASETALPRPTYLVKQLQEALRLRLVEITRRFDLTTGQYTALSVLAKYPGISSAQLARLTFVSPQAANEMVAALERKHLLTRSVDRSNRRRLEVQLTRAGTATLTKCDELVDELETEVFRGVDAKDRAQFHHMLQTCLDAITTA
ncbi:MAG: MarR family winged helix-turn-helix transcriptional regulator [Acidimicrobiia bacterium]